LGKGDGRSSKKMDGRNIEELLALDPEQGRWSNHFRSGWGKWKRQIF
jgi:hypothetical protein